MEQRLVARRCPRRLQPSVAHADLPPRPSRPLLRLAGRSSSLFLRPASAAPRDTAGRADTLPLRLREGLRSADESPQLPHSPWPAAPRPDPARAGHWPPFHLPLYAPGLRAALRPPGSPPAYPPPRSSRPRGV